MDYVNAVCKRLTEPYHPLTGLPWTPQYPERYHGVDACHKYLGEIDEETTIKVVNCDMGTSDWLAYYLCGCERGEYAGIGPFGPIANGLQAWKTLYDNDFNQTPFFWHLGMQTLISFQVPYTGTIVGWHYMGIQDFDTSQQIWCYKPFNDRYDFVMNWMNNCLPQGLGDIRAAKHIMSKPAHSLRYSWSHPIEPEPGKVDWRKYQILPNTVPHRPSRTNIGESLLVTDMLGQETMAYGKWKSMFSDWLDYLIQNYSDPDDYVYFSDAASKAMVKQQYDGSVTVSAGRLQRIAQYITNLDNWQTINEWDVDPAVYVTRLPNHVRITVGNETEFYTLSEAYWHLLSALNDIAHGNSVQYLLLEPVLGPFEYDYYPIDPTDNIYRTKLWAQHDYTGQITFAQLMYQIPGIYSDSFTPWIGPTREYEGHNRRRQMHRVMPRSNILEGIYAKPEVNAAELLYIMAKMYLNWLANPSNPSAVTFQPTHMLPKCVYDFMQNGFFRDIFGSDRDQQLVNFSIGQTWATKPAVLQPDYR